MAILISALFIYRYAQASVSVDKSTAVIFMYQRVGEEQAPQDNISVEQFRAHITELTKAGYSVLPLPKIIDALKNNDSLPPKTVGITFDGAYQATLANAIPTLEEAKFPFTVFFASDMADNGNPAYMNWDQLKKLRKNKLVSFGILPAAYEYMVDKTAEENAAIINRAISRYREMLGAEPVFFAYPYGEYNTDIKKQLARYKFKAVFGQQSGVVYPDSDFLALPRFTMTDDYGGLDRFILTANALPLPAGDVVPEDTMLIKNPPIIGFTINPEIRQLAKLACFGSNLGKLPLSNIGNNRVEIRPDKPFTDRRTRINCTLPNNTIMPGEPRRWRWFGILLIAPTVAEPAADEGSEDTEDPENQ
ncbi:MAG: polysaccharide deacetylase family protein [Proteobacteria bacterium]|nr:polysaccharide deacetylase family protein [Pseudomonadota bacterium]